MNELRFTLSLPPKELSPNARPHYMAKARAVKSYRKSAELLARACATGQPRWREASVRLHFHVKDKRGLKRDGDNCNASCKAILDGLADAGIVENDRCITLLPPTVQIDAETPRLDVEVRSIDP